MKQVSLNRSLLLSAIALTIGTQAAVAQLNTTQTSFWNNLSTTLTAVTLGANKNNSDYLVPKNEYEIIANYKLNSRHTLQYYQLLGHRLEEEFTDNETTGVRTYEPNFYIADLSWFSHYYQITSPRIKNLSIKSKLTYAAPTVEGMAEKNHNGYIDARMQFHFMLNNQQINLGLRPYYRKHLISNLIWEEGDKNPTDFQIGNWFIANFNLASKLSLENSLNLRVNFPVTYSTLSEEEQTKAGITPGSNAVVTTTSNFYSYLRYAFGSSWNAYLHYRNETDFVDEAGYALNVTDDKISVFGIGAEVSF